MKNLTSAVWRNLWQQHHQTKSMLNIFKYVPSDREKPDLSSGGGGGKENVSTPKPGGSGGSDDDRPKKSPYTRAQIIGLLLGPVLFAFTIFFFDPPGLAPEGRAVLAVTLWIAVWWITEAIPIPATSLIPLILFPATGAMEGDDVASAYGNDIIFLFLGGFFIATAMEKWNLHKRIALFIISVIGTSTQRILLGFMVATGFLSFWVSNTAAVMMMIPMGLAITAQVGETLKDKPEKKEFPKLEKSIIFGIGYAGTIGGLGTLIGTPPNIILAAQMDAIFDINMSFARWMVFSVPVVTFLLLCTWFYLGKIHFKTSITKLPGGKELIQKERTSLGRIIYEEVMVAIVFSFAAFMWITREFFWDAEEGALIGIPGISDGMIAVTAAILLFGIPAKAKTSDRILDWTDSKKIPWGVLLLFGGGLAIAAAFTSSGLAEWIGERLTILDGFNILLIIAASTLLVMALTEITSNTATATMILPVVASLAMALEIHPFALMIPCALASTCSFMLPVGTPPNAIMFGTGKLKIIDMIKAGFSLNIFCTIIIVIGVYFYVPVVWGVDLTVFPEVLR